MKSVRTIRALRGDDSAFGITIRAFVDTPGDRHRTNQEQLYDATRFTSRRITDRLSIVLFSDDSNRTELRAVIDFIRKRGNCVVAYLAPRALFEPRGLEDAESIYRDYRSFDRFRHDLTNHDRVVVHEITPL